MSSKRRFEGEVLIDHRDSPGSDAQLAHALGLLHVPGGTRFEGAMISCSHCTRQMVRNPQRTRERDYCRKCDRYICDWCVKVMAESGECVPFKKIMDEAQEAAFRATRSVYSGKQEVNDNG